MSEPLVIDYYTDVLCVWAWIAQRRIDELQSQLGEQIKLRYLYVDVFGDTERKMQTQWSERGGFEGFAEHVRESAGQFEDAPVSADIWTKVRPKTSANAHLVLKAVEDSHSEESSAAFALKIRQAFFLQARDIADLSVLCDICEEENLDSAAIRQSIDSGRAMALLMSDYRQASQQSIKGSPSYVIDGSRQTLYGNVGYRVLHANIEELLKQPKDEASWC